MSDFNEKPTFGASIIRTEPSPNTLQKPKPPHLPLPKPSTDTLTLCSTITPSEPQPSKTEDYDPTSNNPFSAFYLHPTTRTSFEQARSESKLHLALYAHDLESGSRITHASQSDPVPEVPSRVDDKMWPCSKQREKTLLEKQRREGCTPFRRLTKKQKFWVQAVIAVVIVGAITGLGVGITKAVGGGVFKTEDNSSAPISGR